MSLVNEHFLKLKSNYLFAGISDKIKAYKEQHPDADIISLGIGDVTQPLAPAVVEAIHRAADELAKGETFRGYGPEQGYEFLRKAIIQNDYEKRGVHLQLDEVFINDGAKSDLGNFQELIRWDNTIALTDPVYPAYVDANAMIGRSGIQQPDGRWSAVVYLPCNEDNKFVPDLPEQRVDIIYLCYPNNPTGTVLTKPQLQRWVNYAIKNDVLIFYDSAYEAFITDSRIPHSIYEIRGAEKVAVEFRSFSKTAGFTGVRCGYTVVPKDVTVATFDGQRIPLNPLWKRRQSTKYNGTSYISQRAAEAVYSPEGRKQVRDTIAYYMRNAHYMCEELARMGFYVFGGQNAPYLWVKTPDDCDSWAFFDLLLQKANVVCTPGSGFGPSGEGFVRLTAFSTYEQTQKAIQRIKKYAT